MIDNLHTFVDKANFTSLLGGDDVALFRSFWTKMTWTLAFTKAQFEVGVCSLVQLFLMVKEPSITSTTTSIIESIILENGSMAPGMAKARLTLEMGVFTQV